MAVALVASSCGSSNDTVPTQEDLDEAHSFRIDLLNQTYREHLSLSDYIEIRDSACDGAVNDADELLALVETWGLGTYSSDNAAAKAVWLAARQVCPDEFDADNLESGPFFLPNAGGSAPPTLEPIDGLPAGFPEFVDLRVLDDWSSLWAPDEQLSIFAGTSLSEGDAVDHFSDDYLDGWTVNEVLGPIVDTGGLSNWSIDIDGFDWSGVVNVQSMAGDATGQVSVVIVLAKT